MEELGWCNLVTKRTKGPPNRDLQILERNHKDDGVAEVTAQSINHTLQFVTFRLDFRKNFLTKSVVQHFDLEGAGFLSLQVSKTDLNKFVADPVFMIVLLQEEG